MDFQNVFASFDIGAVDQHVAIESTRTHKSLVERFGAVGRCHHDHATVGAEAIHFHKQRVERLFSFVMTADRVPATRFAQRIKFIDEDNARSFGFGDLEHVSHTSRSDADKHFDEVTS